MSGVQSRQTNGHHEADGQVREAGARNSAPAEAPARPAAKERPQTEDEGEVALPEGAEAERIKGVAQKIVENMDLSLQVPTATSLRVLPVKMLAEDRQIINRHLDRKSTRLNSSHVAISYAVFC